MKKGTRLAAVVASAALAAASLGMGVSAQAATQTVTIWSGAKSAAENPINAALVAFGKKNNIKINIVLKPTAMREAFIAAVPTGKGPDLMIGAHDWTGQLVGAGVVAPVSLGASAKKFSTAVQSGFQVNGKLYGVPTWTENIALLWNKRDSKDPSRVNVLFPPDYINGLRIFALLNQFRLQSLAELQAMAEALGNSAELVIADAGTGTPWLRL